MNEQTLTSLLGGVDYVTLYNEFIQNVTVEYHILLLLLSWRPLGI